MPRINRLIEQCRQIGIPVIFTAFAQTHHFFDRPKSGACMPNRYGELGQEDPSWFRPGTVWHELDP